MNTQDLSPLGWTDWISVQFKRLSRVFSNTIVQSNNFLVLSFLHSPTLTSIHDYWKNHSLGFVGKVMSLLFNMLSRLVITFLPRSKHLLISWLHSPSAVILEPQKIICRLSPAKAELPGIQQKEEKMGYPFLFNFLGVSLPFKPETTSSVKYCLIDLL